MDDHARRMKRFNEAMEMVGMRRATPGDVRRWMADPESRDRLMGDVEPTEEDEITMDKVIEAFLMMTREDYEREHAM